MSEIVMLAGQIGIALGTFVGIASAVGWYHKGGERNGNGNKMSGKNF